VSSVLAWQFITKKLEYDLKTNQYTFNGLQQETPSPGIWKYRGVANIMFSYQRNECVTLKKHIQPETINSIPKFSL
jgi:hypothetical protein